MTEFFSFLRGAIVVFKKLGELLDKHEKMCKVIKNKVKGVER